MLRKTLVTLLLATTTPAAQAAEWKIDPTLRFTGGYDDNIRLSTSNEVSSAVGIFSPSSIFSVETPTSGASGELRFDFRRYEADSNLDDNNARFNIRTHHDLERSRLGLDLDFIKDTTLDSQLEATGLVFARINRQRINASPNWTWSFDERTRLTADYNYSDVEYKNAGQTGFVNYTLNVGQLSLTRVLTERTTGTIALSRTRSDNDNDVKSTNTNLQGGAEHRFSETLSATLFAGVRHTEVDYSQTSFIPIFIGGTLVGFEPLNQDVSKSDWGYVFSGGITKKFLRGETSFTASRDISNDINGTPIEVDRLGWLNLYRFSETLSGNLDLALYHSKTDNSVSSGLNRDYYQVQPRLNWQFAQFWVLSGSYRYIKQTYDNTSDDAVGNAAYLTLTYQWPRIAVSR
jgi:hypothetical protein